MIKKILFISVLFISLVASGQLETELTAYKDESLPVPPTEASLGSYGHSPVSLAKGELGLGIPLYTLKGKDLALPISMSYRQGVRIHDASEYTGQGWSLLAGGVITRKVNHLDDLKYPDRRFDWDNDMKNEQNFNDMYTNQLDSAFDEFTYNFNGYAGEFVLEEDLITPYFVGENRNWKISTSSNEIIIIIEDGTKYIFNDIRNEDLDFDFPEGYTETVTVAWYLTEIVSPKINEKIILSYSDNNFTCDRIKNNSLIINPYNQSTMVIPDSNDKDTQAFIVKRIEEIKLVSNDTDVSKVIFEANTLRTDTYENAPNAYALSRLSIYNDPNSSEPLKYFDFVIENVNNDRIFLTSIQEFTGDGSDFKPPYLFEYINPHLLPSRTAYKADHWGYFSSTGGGEYPFISDFSWLSNSTKEPDQATAKYGSLKKVVYPTGGYSFYEYESNFYNETSSNSQQKITLELDWRENHLKRWETLTGTVTNSLTEEFTLTEEQFVKLNFTLILEKNPGLFLGDLMDEIDEYKISITDDDSGEEIFYVIFEGDQGSDTPVAMRVYADQYLNSFPDTNSSQGVSSNLYSGNVGRLPSSNSIIYEGTPYYDFYETPGKIGDYLDRNLYLFMEPGNYTANIQTSSINNSMEEAFIELNFEFNEVNTYTNSVPAGGIRVASQTTYEPISEEERTITYRYTESDGDGKLTSKGSGLITNKPIIPLYNPINVGPGRTGIISDRYRLNSLTKHIQNSWVNYSEVQEIEGNNGYKIHKFYNTSYTNYIIRGGLVEEPNGNSGWHTTFENQKPIYYWTDSWPHEYDVYPTGIVNKPYSIATYKYGSIKPILLNEEKYTYDLIRRDYMLKGVIVSEYHQDNTTTTSYLTHRTRINNTYSLLENKESITYNQKGEKPITTKTTFDYRSGYIIPNKITTKTSNGETLIKKIKYPFDFQNSASFGSGSTLTIQDFKNRNMYVPIEEQLWELKNNLPKLINGRLNIYNRISDSSTLNNLFQPTEILNLESSSLAFNPSIINEFNSLYHSNIHWYNSVEDIDYNRGVNLVYDDSGSIEFTTPKDGSSVYYIWGYNKQYPIAKFENFESALMTNSLQQFINAIITESNNENSVDKENLLRIELNKLRNNSVLDNAMVSTYTYDPLVGVTSMTDPRGYTIYYIYDDFNRLKEVRDADNNLVSDYEYNYKD